MGDSLTTRVRHALSANTNPDSPLTRQEIAALPGLAHFNTKSVLSAIGKLFRDENYGQIHRDENSKPRKYWFEDRAWIAPIFLLRTDKGDEHETIPMILYCPSGHRHIDEKEFANKAHHTHACQECGHVWRPAKVNTHGVRFLPGYKNED